MRRGAAAILAAAILAGCGGSGGSPGPIEGDLAIDVVADSSEIEFGKAFPLTVVRAWDKSLVPDAWDERALAPLVARQESIETRESGRHVVETRRYAAYAFVREAVTVEGPSITARPPGGGRERTVRGEALRLAVRGALPDPLAPGPPEPPGDLLREPFPWGLVLAGGAGVLLLASGALVLLLKRRRASDTDSTRTVAPRGATPRERALARLDALRPRLVGSPRSREETVAAYLEAAALLRDYLTERHAFDARAMTREQILAASKIDSDRRSGLASWLAACDLVIFARHEPPEAERETFLRDAGAFLASDDASA